MTRMIHDVIEFARGQLGGAIPITLISGHLGDITREAVNELRIGHPDRVITLNETGDLRGRWDRDRVVQVVSNLVANALAYGEDPIAVLVTEAKDGEELRLSVNNRGPVIATDRLAVLFDPLRQETSDDARGGLGLGLYIVRHVALAHGARCEVSSTEADGTTFSVIWPRARTDVSFEPS